MSRTFFTCICLAFIPIFALAQSIGGAVTDEQGKPIEFANVVALDKDSAFIHGVVTDAAGSFRLSNLPVKAALVRVSSIGYNDSTLLISGRSDLGKIRLKSEATMLSEVVVKSSLPKTRIEGDAIVTTVAHSLLADAGTANDALAKVPLVTGSEGNFTVFGAGTPVIYINGKIVRSATELKTLSSRDIKSVEVISNPGAKYDAETNAVIRIKTLPPKGEGFSSSLNTSTRFAHYAENSSDLLLKYRHQGLEVFFQGYFQGGKRKYRELGSMTTYSEEIFKQELESHTVTSNSGVSGKLGFNYQPSENHSFGAYYQLGRYKEKPTGTLNTDITINGQLDQELNQSSRGKELTQPSHEANAYYNGTIGKLSVDFNADFVRTSKTKTETQYEHILEGSSRTVSTNADNTNRLWAEKLVLSHPLGKGSLTLGEEYTNSHISYQSLYTGADITGGNSKIKESNIAAFMQLSQRFKWFNLGIGLRYEHVKNKSADNSSDGKETSRTYNNWFPSLNLSGKIKAVGWSLNFTSRTHRPTYRQLDGTLQYVNRYSYQVGNPSLKPSRRYTTQLMLQWKYFFAQASFTHEKDAIFYTTQRYNNSPTVKLIVFENVPKYQQFQLVAGAQPTFGLWHPMFLLGMVRSSYETEVQGKTKELHKPIFLMNWRNSFALPKGWVIDADFEGKTSGNAQNCYVKATSRVNLGVRKSFWNNKLTLQLKANDIFDTNNERLTMYSGDIETGSKNYHESRNIVLSLRLNLNTSRSKYAGKGAGNEEKGRL